MSGAYASCSGVYQALGIDTRNQRKSKESNGEGLKRKPNPASLPGFDTSTCSAAPQIIFWEAARYVLCPTAFFSGFCSAKIAAPATTASSAIIEKNASFDIFS